MEYKKQEVHTWAHASKRESICKDGWANTARIMSALAEPGVQSFGYTLAHCMNGDHHEEIL